MLPVFYADFWRVNQPVHGDHPLLSAKCSRLAGGWPSVCESSSSSSVGPTAAGQRPDTSAAAPGVTRLLYRGACPLHAIAVSPNALPPAVGSTPPPPTRFSPIHRPLTVSGGIGDLGSCLMSVVDPASRRVKELETDGGGGGGGGTDGRTGGTGAAIAVDLPFTELQRQTHRCRQSRSNARKTLSIQQLRSTAWEMTPLRRRAFSRRGLHMTSIGQMAGSTNNQPGQYANSPGSRPTVMQNSPFLSYRTITNTHCVYSALRDSHADLTWVAG